MAQFDKEMNVEEYIEYMKDVKDSFTFDRNTYYYIMDRDGVDHLTLYGKVISHKHHKYEVIKVTYGGARSVQRAFGY